VAAAGAPRNLKGPRHEDPRARVYRGPSQYAHFPVIRLTVDLGALEAWPSGKLPGFNDGAARGAAALEQHTCSYGEAGGFVRRLTEDEGTWLGHVLEHVAIEVQQLAGAKVTSARPAAPGAAGQYHVVYEYEEERVGEAAGDLALTC
jgi:cyanophycin synthetase